MPQVKMKAKLGASLVQPKSRGTPRLPPPARPGAPPATEPDPLSSEALAGSGIFFQKGVASAVGFRPTQWTYERETEDAAPPLSLSSAPRLAVLPGGAAEPAKPPLPSASLLQIETPPPRLTLLPPAAEEPAAEAVAAKVVALAPVAPAPSARAETRGSPPLGSAEIEALLAARDDHGEGGVEPQPVAVAPAAPATPATRAPSEPLAVERELSARAPSLLEDEPAFSFRAPPARDRRTEPAETISRRPEPPEPAPVEPRQQASPRAEALPVVAPVAEPPAPPPAVSVVDVPQERPLAEIDVAVSPAPEPLGMEPAAAEALAPEPEQAMPALAVADDPIAEPAVEPFAPAAAALAPATPESRLLQESDVANSPAADSPRPTPSEPAPPESKQAAEPSVDMAPLDEPAAPAPATSEFESLKERLLAELGAAIESVMSKRWYGVPTGTPLAPAAAMSLAPLPAVTHSALIAELAAAAPPPPAPIARRGGFPVDILIASLCGGALAFGYLVWGVPAPLAEAFRELLRLVS